MRVRVQLALIDDAVFVLMEELHRIFNRDDVLVPLAIDLVDHRRERRRFAGAGRAGDEHESARLIADLLDHLRQPELLESEDLVGDLPVDGGRRAALIEDVRAEARETLDAERNVELEVFLETMLLRVGEHRVRELLRLRRRQRRHIERRQLAVDADLRWRVRGDVKVRTAVFHNHF